MSRTISELRQEAFNNGWEFSQKFSIDEAQDFLARAIWERENPGVPLPVQFKVMLARDASKLSYPEFHNEFDNDDWVAELKLNGCRGILILEDGKSPRMTSRRRSDQHHRYEENIDNVPHFRDFAWRFEGLTVLDGELVHPLNSIVTSEGTKTENQLQTSVAMLNSEPTKGVAMQQQYGKLDYWVFDALFINGEDLRDQPFSYRRKLLEEFLSEQEHKHLKITPQWSYAQEMNEIGGGFYELYKKLVKEGKEGIMLKATHGRYVSTGRPKTMWKMKERVTFDAFITGFVPSAKGKGFENYIGAFEVSAFIDGKERVIGAVASVDLVTRQNATVLVDGKPSLNPKYLGRCMEIKGQTWTKNMRLFHCQKVDWRPDKSPSDCQIRGEDVKVNRTG